MQNIDGIEPDDWDAATFLKPVYSAKILGYMEMLLYYIAFCHDFKSGSYIVGGWLAFKVASKWQSWNTVVKTPTEFVSDEENDIKNKIEELRTRNIWGTRLLSSFLVGTLCNILLAIFGAFIAKNLLSH